MVIRICLIRYVFDAYAHFGFVCEIIARLPLVGALCDGAAYFAFYYVDNLRYLERTLGYLWWVGRFGYDWDDFTAFISYFYA